MFKNLMGFMGDKALQFPTLLAKEILEKCLESPAVRDETFCQIVKQLSDNPKPFVLFLYPFHLPLSIPFYLPSALPFPRRSSSSSAFVCNRESLQRGWQMMSLCLEVFPPGSDLENYLEYWLRLHSSPEQELVLKLHRSVYGGALKAPPTDAEIEQIISGLLSFALSLLLLLIAPTALLRPP